MWVITCSCYTFCFCLVFLWTCCKCCINSLCYLQLTLNLNAQFPARIKHINARTKTKPKDFSVNKSTTWQTFFFFSRNVSQAVTKPSLSWLNLDILTLLTHRMHDAYSTPEWLECTVPRPWGEPASSEVYTYTHTHKAVTLSLFCHIPMEIKLPEVK